MKHGVGTNLRGLCASASSLYISAFADNAARFFSALFFWFFCFIFGALVHP